MANEIEMLRDEILAIKQQVNNVIRRVNFELAQQEQAENEMLKDIFGGNKNELN